MIESDKPIEVILDDFIDNSYLNIIYQPKKSFYTEINGNNTKKIYS